MNSAMIFSMGLLYLAGVVLQSAGETTQAVVTKAATTKAAPPAPTQAPTKPPSTQAPTKPPSTQAPTQPPSTQAPTTAPATTEAPAPQPTPPSKPSSFRLKGSGKTCTRVDMIARIQTGKTFDYIPKEAVVTGNCSESMILTWDKKNSLSFFFKKYGAVNKTDDKKWAVEKIDATFKGKTFSFSSNDTKEFTADIGSSFGCNANQTLKNGDDLLSFDHLNMQTFMKSEDFGRTERCAKDKAQNNVVPIAVGAALAALVIVVLVLYLIGRRKHQKGYQTV